MTDAIEISCPRHVSHFVAALGFLLLEEVEQAFGSAVQEVICIQAFVLCEPLLSRIGSRVSRQQRKIGRIDLVWVRCATKHSVEALSVLIQKCANSWFIIKIQVLGKIDADGWASLARALLPDPAPVHYAAIH